MISFLISIIKIIILLGLLIFIHELGHFTVAKLCKVRVNEFAIGFGPTIWKKQGKVTKYALRLIPLGGFISMEGEEERSEKSDSFSQASIPKRIAIVAAGAIVNIMFAIILYFILIFNTGPYITNEIDSIIEGYPAQEIGLQHGDKIIQINEQKINNMYDLNKVLIKNTAEIKVKIERSKEIIEYKTIAKKITEEGYTSYYLGVNLKPAEDNLINRGVKGIIGTREFLFSIVESIKDLFTGKVGVDQMVGPVGISKVVAKTNGLEEFFQTMALISLSLGVTNLLPIPALDGGKIVLLIIEAIRKKPLKQEVEINLQLIGFAVLIALSLYVTYNDIRGI